MNSRQQKGIVTPFTEDREKGGTRKRRATILQIRTEVNHMHRAGGGRYVGRSAPTLQRRTPTEIHRPACKEKKKRRSLIMRSHRIGVLPERGKLISDSPASDVVTYVRVGDRWCVVDFFLFLTILSIYTRMTHHDPAEVRW